MTKTYYVTMLCHVKKQVAVECETEDQARESPWDYAVEEWETDQIDWEVLDVKEGS